MSMVKLMSISKVPPRLSMPKLLPTKTLTRLSQLTSPLRVSTMSTESTQRMFQLSLDPLTGNSEWVVVEENDDEDGGGAKSAVSLETTSYLDMLNDKGRNRAYRVAIEKAVKGGGGDCRVLDIGAGTGLLSMMAARAMGSGNSKEYTTSERMVTACESYLPMVKMMRKVLRANGLESKVRVINKRSDELVVGSDIAERANVLVSEILDSELLGEGLIPTLQHAHDKLLVENPRTVPYRATTYGQFVESTYLWKLHDLFHQEEKVIDGIRLVPEGMENLLCVKPQQIPMQCDALRDEIKLLSEPFQIFDFDFSKRPESRGETVLHIKATNDGTVHAVISWWILQLDREGEIFYSTAPKWVNCPFQIPELQSSQPSEGVWCDHWKQCVWFSRGKGLPLCKDEDVYLEAYHTDTRILYEIRSSLPKLDVVNESCAQDNQITLSPERIALFGDSDWRCSMVTAIEKVLEQKASPLCVVADDSVFLSIAIANLSRTSQVISLFPGIREKGSAYLQAIAGKNGFSVDRIELVHKKQGLTMNDTHQRKVDLLVAEPFYNGRESMLPWQNLRFWKERTMLDPILSEDVKIMPCKGILKACAMYLPDLWRSRRCLKEIEGFDHSVVNATLGACGGVPVSQDVPCLPFFVWQCGEIKKLSEICTVMEFDFSKPLSACSGKVKVDFTKFGTCHGFVLWVDWVMDLENSIVVSTGPDKRYWKQGVKLLREPVVVGRNGASSSVSCSAVLEASFHPSSGDLTIEHSST